METEMRIKFRIRKLTTLEVQREEVAETLETTTSPDHTLRTTTIEGMEVKEAEEATEVEEGLEAVLEATGKKADNSSGETIATKPMEITTTGETKIHKTKDLISSRKKASFIEI